MNSKALWTDELLEVRRMTEGDEFGRTFFRFLAQIAEREKTKAIERDEYGAALAATFLEGFFKEAERSFN